MHAEQKKEEPVAVQPPKSLDCGPKPSSVSNRDQKDQQLWRLASMQHELCLSGRFQGVVAESWTKLKTRVENATTSHERTLISFEIEQFASAFMYGNSQREAELREAERLDVERREAERREAERLEAKRREATEQLEVEAERLDAERALIKKKLSDTANLDTTKCQPVVSTDCMRELLMQRLRIVQEAFLRTNPPSKLQPIRELVAIGNEIRAASTSEKLQQAWQVLNAWQQRHLPQ
ncbi:hypothetical protein BO221_39875 [Archangium sp. Cb G35]|uniref:hypothetical protein n=1 Tax=Archangium sp. Cb G35 TaxID=1920190 RepID=UPI000937E7FA|nr:hypothetical protein [Archangium sp. Cb G35]OJT18873.1 hypothetical protein BO221_39875 [Archangium sp. Cb G35]